MAMPRSSSSRIIHIWGATLHLGVPSWGDTADSLKHDDKRIISKCDIWKLFQKRRMLKQVCGGN